MFIELHMIQNFSPANLNRDDTGNPKDCTFGGYRRARVSSQALKRAIRYEKVFKDTTNVEPSTRTKLIFDGLTKRMNVSDDKKESAKKVAVEFAKVYSSKKGNMDTNNPDKTSTALFMAEQELDELATQLKELTWDEVLKEIEHLDSKKMKAETRINKSPVKPIVDEWIKKTKMRTSAPDIALFGRMLADRPETNVDAACQVAHALSTHRISMEMDFFTAVDDLQPKDKPGSAHMDITNFNSACFYRYARIDWNLLVENLGKDKALAHRTVEGFMRAALDAIPTGKQNAFAAQNPTNLALAIVREDGQSWNLANAFEEPVYPKGDSGLIRRSIEALDTYWGDMKERRDDAEFKAISVYTDSSKSEEALNTLAEYSNPKLSAWIEAINEALPKE
jgi:CRISPR system Cascade subunit CasC